MAKTISPTGREIYFDRDDIIVSKTDLKGRLTYANNLFQTLAGYSESELLGKQHNIIRHPDMPRAVFKLLWDTILGGGEIFAYVKNMSRNGDHYWVLAHVTPSFDASGQMIGFHSNRRAPDRKAVETITAVYADLLRIEAQHRNGKDALAASTQHFQEYVSTTRKSYDELVLSL